MFCPNCGKQLVSGTNFCPACGVPMGDSARAQGPTQNGSSRGSVLPGGDPRTDWSGAPLQGAGQLIRPRSPRLLGGVCAAFALRFGWNLDLVRIVAAVLALVYGLGILAYVVCWILLPEAPYALSQQSS